MARPLSAAQLRRHAIVTLKAGIALALQNNDHSAAIAGSIRLEQMASRVQKQQAMKSGSTAGAIASRLSSANAHAAQGLHVGRSSTADPYISEG